MNWLSTDAHKAQGNCLLLLTCLILSCIVPLIFCQEEDKATQYEPHTNGEIASLKHRKVHWTHHDKGGRHLNGEPTLRVKSNTIQRRHKDGFVKPLKGHGKHKKQARNRNKFHRDFGISQENAKKNHLNYLESEKKYFDYFPVEDTQRKLVPLRDEDVEVVLLLNDTSSFGEKILKSPENSKSGKKISRSKRGIPQAEAYVIPNYNYVRNFLATEQGAGSPPVVSLTNKINQADQYYSQGTANDPWSNRFTQPVNNIYLPIPRPFAPASVPHNKYPIPGIYYNAVSPSGSYPVIRRTNKPAVGSRFGEEEDRVIWEIKYVGGTERPTYSAAAPPQVAVAGGFGGSSSGFGGVQEIPVPPVTQTRTTTRAPARGSTRAPAPPLIHMDNRGRRPSGQPSNNRPSNAIPQSQAPRIASQPTSRPTTQNTEPSKCVWAIVSCCSRNNLQIRYNCFEQLGCHGAFWDYNPCADNFQDAALNQADSFFQR